MADDPAAPDLPGDLLADLALLVEAGLLEGYEIDAAGDRGAAVLSPAAAALLRSGRLLWAEPLFLRLMASGDPAAVRRWLEAQAAALPAPDGPGGATP